MRLLMLIVIEIFIFIASSFVIAQTHFKGVSNTGSNATLALLTTANPNIMGAPLVTDDEIGVFTPAGLCVGAAVWEVGKNAAIIVWGDNDQTPAPEIDGMRAGEQMRFCVWQKSSGTGYGEVSVSYSSGDGLYATNGIYVLSSLTANAVVAPLPPKLESPASGTTGITTVPSLSWYTACGAGTYALQIDDTPDFSSFLIVDQSGIDSTSYVFSGVASNTTYYWRVSSQNAVGASGWSSDRSFTTGMITGVDDASPEIPQGYILHQNYPNPFNASTSIGFHLPVAGVVTLKIFDIRGNEVATVLDGEKSAGDHRLLFDAADLASGVYFYRIEARASTPHAGQGFIEARKLLLIK